MTNPVTVGPRVDVIAQALHVGCSDAATRRHQWREHQADAARVDVVLGAVSEQQLRAAFERGFHTRDNDVAEAVARAQQLELDGQRLTQMLGDASAANKRLRARLADLTEVHNSERAARNDAVAAAEAARRELLTETQRRAQADDRATAISHELRDMSRELAAARQRISALEASRAHVAHLLEHDYNTTPMKEKTA